MVICSFLAARTSRLAYFPPPYADPVLQVYCKPPKKPFPVLMCQSPDDSHAATLSQVLTVAASVGAAAESAATPAIPAVPTAAIASCCLRFLCEPMRERSSPVAAPSRTGV